MIIELTHAELTHIRNARARILQGPNWSMDYWAKTANNEYVEPSDPSAVKWSGDGAMIAELGLTLDQFLRRNQYTYDVYFEYLDATALSLYHWPLDSINRGASPKTRNSKGVPSRSKCHKAVLDVYGVAITNLENYLK